MHNSNSNWNQESPNHEPEAGAEVSTVQIPVPDQGPLPSTEEFTLDSRQYEAVNLCTEINKRLIAVTGQAGTGKTTIMRLVADDLRKHGYRVVFTAPTGKAARRISEATGYQAMTIHKLLEYPHPGERDPKTGKSLDITLPKRNRHTPLDFDVVLADEYAMVNSDVHRNLVDALRTGAALRVFGDENQLRPIEKNKLKMREPSPFLMILSKFIGVRLEQIHRQAEGSGIVANGALILRGRRPVTKPDFLLSLTNSPVDSVLKAVAASDKEFSTIDSQIISPTKKTWVGTGKLNATLQTHFRGTNGPWIEPPRHPWAHDKGMRITVGDKVIWTENNYDLGIMNGETGIVIEIEHEHNSFVIDFGDKEVEIPPVVVNEYSGKSYDPRRSVELAYVVTTHKAQGSEYQKVIYVMNKSCRWILSRSNLYTGITRARKHVTLITDAVALTTAVTRIETLMDTRDAQ